VRRRALWQPVLGIVLLMGALLVLTDRVAAKVAADQLGSRVGTELVARGVSYSSLDVQVGGLPFLTQVAQGRYSSIGITMTGVQVPIDGGHKASLPSMHVVATGVRADTATLVRSGVSAVDADHVTGTAVISYDTLAGLVDQQRYHLSQLTFSERDGGLWATATVTVSGVSVPVQAATSVVLAGTVIQIRLRDASVVGVQLPGSVLSMVDQVANAVIEANMPPLPFNLALHDVTVAPAGLSVTINGDNVPLAPARAAG
jgi:hypothetical protein